MLGTLSESLANIISYRPQEKSKYKPEFPRVKQKGRGQIKQQNHELLVPAVQGTALPVHCCLAPAVAHGEWSQKMAVLAAWGQAGPGFLCQH